MYSLRLRRLLQLVSCCSVALATASAARAAFPTDPPNDPNYAADVCPPATTCLGPSGQWNLFSVDAHIPPTTRPSGISADLAWQVTIGRPDVAIAILDSGVDYDHEDLRNKIWLNRGELPIPLGICTPPFGDPHDCNGDGVFNVEDYAGDPRVSDLNADGDVDRTDLRVFVDGIDNDANGYVDDLSGFDTDDDDGDEFDHRYFGHGTGRAGIAAPETNNGLGVAGVCPRCPLMNVRIDDTFVCSSEGVAKAAIYAIDNGAKVLSMSLGGQTASRLSRGAMNYAISKDVLPVNASANEFSFHHNFQAIFDDVMTVGGITPDSTTVTTTWLQKANFSNYGAHLDVVAPTVMPGASMGMTGGGLPDHAAYTESASGTSSSTPHAAAVAGLVFSRGLDLGLTPALSAQEVRQIIDATADDITPADGTSYAVAVGWDKYTGYGRVNAKAAVDRVGAATIPPEADIKGPDWYTLNDGNVSVVYYANARRATTLSLVLEVGSGVEPLSFSTLVSLTGLPANPAVSSADRTINGQTTWSTSALPNGFYTLRLRVTDDLGNVGEDRMGVWVRHPDPQDMPGFPRVFEGSLDTLSVATVDLDDDNTLEIVFADGNGEIHAVREDATDLPGFPVHTDVPKNLPLTTSDAFDGDFDNGEVALSFASIIGGVAVADLDRDGQQEIVAAANDGQVYCWHGDASVCASFPVSTDHGFSRDPYPPFTQVMNASRGEGILATPALGNLDGDPGLEIVVGSLDQKLYVWHADGSRMAPFPIQLFDSAAAAGVSSVAPKAIVSSAAIADMDADGDNDIVVGTNEVYGTPGPPAPIPGSGSGRAYLVHADGAIAPGWPVKPTSVQPSAVPVVAEGVPSSPVVGNVGGDATLETITTAFLGDPTVFNADGSTGTIMQGAPFGGTAAGADLDETTAEGGLALPVDAPSHFYVAQGALGDLEGTGQLSYTTGSVGNGILAIAAGAGAPAVFNHLLSVWDATTGVQKPAFPRVIEDWQFVIGPAVAEISGDALPEIIESSGGYYVHAFNSAGLEPAGWPKLTGQWQTATASVGDLDDDGAVEVVQASRLGTLFVWKTAGATCQNDQWRKFRHDEWNTGTYGADTRRPAGIDDLVVTPAGTDVVLTWTAVGDDGRCGTATSYELRASSAPITRANFASATLIVVTPPAASGASESRTVTPPAGARFFAVRAVDEVGNAGPIAAIMLGACATSPQSGCRLPFVRRGAQLQIVDRTPDTKDRLVWKWGHGAATGKADFGNPVAPSGTSYRLCFYDGGGTLLAGDTAPAGGLCGTPTRPCWKDVRTGFRYNDKDRTPDGVQHVVLKAGTDGKAKIQVDGKGVDLDLPALPITTLPLTVQLMSSDGECWSATYSTTLRNRSDQLKARSD